MASAASSQHRCVFVGNIPYDATEELLIQICEEVGPVVSFRLVLDRETGKPKGYGFCEYKDEETALSARRNLQGYEINGRQLRVDFAENDKGTDRTREQGRGGPGLTSSSDGQKPLPGPPIFGDLAPHQPVGLPLASTAASVMARALGGPQCSSLSIQNGLQNFSGFGNDPLTHYLSQQSRHHLNEIMSELKTLATQNKPLATQLLQGSSQLSKALFQAQIILGLVNPQMLQMASSRLSSCPVPQSSLQNDTPGQRPALPPYPGQTPAQKETFSMVTQPPVHQALHVLQNSTCVQQSAPPPQHVNVQPQLQHSSLPLAHAQSKCMLTGHSGIPTMPILQHQSGSLSVQPLPLPLPTSKGLKQPVQPSLLQHPRPNGAANGTHYPYTALPSTSTQEPLLHHPPTTMIDSSNHHALSELDKLPKEVDPSASGSHWPSRINTHPNSGVGKLEQIRVAGDLSAMTSHPSKRPRLDDGSGAPQATNNNSSVSKPGLGQPSAIGSLPGNQTAGLDWMQDSDKQTSQLPPEVESALLQQVLSLTSEQLSSLPLEQRQQVLQLQQKLRELEG